MPIFEYKCLGCSKVSEHYVARGNTDELKCPHCKSTKLEKITLSRFAVGSSYGSESCGTESDCHSCCSSGACHHKSR